MKRLMMILATAALASTLAVGAADARGGGGFGGGGHGGGFGGGGFGGGAHIGGFGGGTHIGGISGGAHLGGPGGGAHIGGVVGGTHLGALGGGVHARGTVMPGRMASVDGDHLGVDEGSHPHGGGVQHHAIHHDRRYWSGYAYYYDNPDCYDWYLLHPDQPLPLSCS